VIGSYNQWVSLIQKGFKKHLCIKVTCKKSHFLDHESKSGSSAALIGLVKGGSCWGASGAAPSVTAHLQREQKQGFTKAQGKERNKTICLSVKLERSK